MATIQEKLEFLKNNPEHRSASAYMQGLATGNFDEQARAEGFDLSPISKSFKQTQGDVGTGFTPTFQSNEDDNILQSTGKTIGNVPRSAFELGKDVVEIVSKPKQTIKAIGSIFKGLGARVGEKFLEDTEIGKRFLEKANKSRIYRGLEPLKIDKEGNLQAEDTPELEGIRQVGDFFRERYGSFDKLRESLVEDPVGVVADFASLLTGVGAVVRGGGTVSKLSKVANIGSKIKKAGTALEPTSLIAKGVSKTKNLLKPGETVKSIVKDVVPFDRSEVTRSGVVRALDFSPTDITKIEKQTGNKIDNFILENTTSNTIPGITKELIELKDVSRAQVRDLIGNVKNTYSGDDILRVSQSLDVLENLYKNTVGNEEVLKSIAEIKAKKSITLGDAQLAKELLDEADLIFRQAGDVKSGAKSKGLETVRRDIKEFIENEVETNLGGEQGNIIRELNNKTQTSKGLEDLIQARANKSLTRTGINAWEFLLGIGGYSQFGLVGTAGILVGKRLLQSPTFRISLARAVRSSNSGKVGKLSAAINKLKKGDKLPVEMQAVARGIFEEAKKNKQLIESGANTIQEVPEENTQ